MPLGGCSAVTVLKYKACAYTFKFKRRLFGTIRCPYTQKGLQINNNCDDMRPQTVKPLFDECDPLNTVNVEYSWQGLAVRGFCWSKPQNTL